MTKLELIKNAKSELKKVLDFIKENESALLNYHDLKLHDVSYYCYTEMKKDFPLCYANANENNTDYFYKFCDCEYDVFKEDLRENAEIDFEKSVKYIRNTSKFYLWQYGDESNAIDLLNALLDKYISDGPRIYYTSKLNLDYDINFHTSADVFENLTAIANGDFYIYVLEQTSVPITIYKQIKAFKDNQVETFKDFLECCENDLQEEIDAEKARIMTDKNNADNIARFYGIPDATMQELKKCIYAY